MTKFITRVIILISLGLGLTSAANAEPQWLVKESPNSVTQTADKLEAAVKKAGATVFARIDHQAGAIKIGEKLEATTVVIFGNPKLGTPIIRANRRAGIDLPIRVLIWQEGDKTFIGTMTPEELKTRYEIKGVDGVFNKMGGALAKLMGAAIAP